MYYNSNTVYIDVDVNNLISITTNTTEDVHGYIRNNTASFFFKTQETLIHLKKMCCLYLNSTLKVCLHFHLKFHNFATDINLKRNLKV